MTIIDLGLGLVVNLYIMHLNICSEFVTNHCFKLNKRWIAHFWRVLDQLYHLANFSCEVLIATD